LRNRMKIIVGAFAIMMIVMFTGMIATPAHAQITEPHNADAMWVEPSVVNLDTSSIGTTFNATVCLNLTEALFSYEFGLHYNRTLLQCTRAGFTNGSTSAYCTGHTTVALGPTIDTSSLGNGSVLAGESCLSVDNVTGHADTLAWMTFEVLNFTTFLPPSGNLTTTLDISTEYPSNTVVLDPNVNPIDFTPSNSSVVITPEFAYMLILPTFMALTLAGAILSKRRQKRLI